MLICLSSVLLIMEQLKIILILKLLKKHEVAEDAEAKEKFFKFQGMSRLSKFIEDNKEIQDFLYDEIKSVL